MTRKEEYHFTKGKQASPRFIDRLMGRTQYFEGVGFVKPKDSVKILNGPSLHRRRRERPILDVHFKNSRKSEHHWNLKNRFVNWLSHPRLGVPDLFGNRKFVLGIVILAVILGGINLAQGPLFHSTVYLPNNRNGDPFTLLWNGTVTANYPYAYNAGSERNCASGYLCLNAGVDVNNFVFTQAEANSPVTVDSFHPVVDTMFSTCNGTAFASFYGETFQIKTIPRQITSVQFLMNKTNTWTGGIVAQIWNLQGSPGTTGLPLGSFSSGGFPQVALQSSTPLTDSSVMPTNASATAVTFIFAAPQILQKGNYVVSLTENSTLASGASPLIGRGLSSGCHAIVNTEVKKGGTFAGHNGFQGTKPFNDVVACITICDFWFTVTAQPSSAVELTTSPIDVSTSASKELLFFETWHNFTTIAASFPWGWYLTTNKTLPIQAGYSPLNDPSVAMASVVYPAGGASNVKNYYNYQSKNGNQKLVADSNLGTDPYPNCPQTATLYECIHSTGGYGSQYLSISNTLNFTGNGGASGAGSSQSSSLFCNDTVPAALTFCSSQLAGGGPFSPCTASTQACATNTFPFLNMQSGPFYLGFWSSVGQTAVIQFGTTNSGTLDVRANAVYYWLPNPATTAVVPPSTLDPGGFFGPLIKALLGIGIWIVTNVISFLVYIAQVAWPLFAAAWSLLVNAEKGVLDAIGNFFGLGPIGTSFIGFLTNAGSFIVQYLSGVTSQIGNSLGFVVIAITQIIKFFNDSGGQIWSTLSDLLNVIGPVFQFFFNVYNTFTSLGLSSVQVMALIMIAWWIYGIFTVLTQGSRVWWDHWVISTKNIIETTFNGMYWFIQFGIDWMIRLKSLIAGWL